MGLSLELKQCEERILSKLDWSYAGLNWLELGNQRDRTGNPRSKKPAKIMYESLGVNHISIDLNGRNGALPLDLQKPLPFIFHSRFDVITNYGTIEHVNNQYRVFRNIHDSCRKGGIIIHALPLENNWPKHCRYKYTTSFAGKLAKKNSYTLVQEEIIRPQPYQLLVVAYRKELDEPFMRKSHFRRMGGILDTGDKRKTGNYTVR